MDNFNLNAPKWPSFRGEMTCSILKYMSIVYEEDHKFHLQKDALYKDYILTFLELVEFFWWVAKQFLVLTWTKPKNDSMNFIIIYQVLSCLHPNVCMIFPLSSSAHYFIVSWQCFTLQASNFNSFNSFLHFQIFSFPACMVQG